MTNAMTVPAPRSAPITITGPASPTRRRSTRRGHLAAVLRTTALLTLAGLAILVLLPAAIAVQSVIAR